MLSCFSAWSLFQVEERAITSEFQNDTQERATSLYRQMDINFEALRSLAIIFNREGVPEPELFNLEARKIIVRHQAIQALEWIPRIKHSERSKYESDRRLQFSAFEITEQKTQGHMLTASERAEYFPVYYIEPLTGNETAFGFDLASSAIRLQALEQSRDSGLPQATASITLVQEHSNQLGFLAFLPIYSGFPLTVATRQEQLKGFVLGVYRINDIFASSALNGESPELSFRIVDETDSNSHDILHIDPPKSPFILHPTISHRVQLSDIWGRKWSLITSPSLNYISSRRDVLPLLTFLTGIIFTLFITMYLHITSRRAAIIESIVIQKTNELNEANEKLESLSRTDALTGIPNRRSLDEFIELEWLRAIRNRSSLSTILIDIDYFKNYNDNYGHIKGDECLRIVATRLNSLVHRPGDLVARYGGEEFILILSDTEDADQVADLCCQSIEDLQIPHEFSDVTSVVTISLGLCTTTPEKGTDPSLIIDNADKALYKAKSAGRNRVETYVSSSRP
ncbi:MAG TPA: diguanylate cyclase [Gammaproteobacteria bacterium]|nr:diguanylate cyclase [Gammaproteobacteria bacterium]HIL99353.1 diguanylate cyclase [Pseudomonadales bacterium]